MEFLKTKFGPGKPIFTENAEPLGLSAGNLRQQFKKLVDSGELFRYEPGVYFLPNPNHEYYSISSNMVAEYKYITDGDEIYGYYSGYTFANQLGLCLQVPYKEEIATSSNKVVFKGGTSLSKALKAINRFSEDIDISFSEHIGASRYFRLSTLTNNSENFCKKFVKYGVHWIFALRQNPEST